MKMLQLLLENGSYLATSKDIQGLVAQGRTVQETAKDVVRKLMEAQTERKNVFPINKIKNYFDYPLVIGM